MSTARFGTRTTMSFRLRGRRAGARPSGSSRPLPRAPSWPPRARAVRGWRFPAWPLGLQSIVFFELRLKQGDQLDQALTCQADASERRDRHVVDLPELSAYLLGRSHER